MMHESRNDETHCMKKILLSKQRHCTTFNRNLWVFVQNKVIPFKKNNVLLDQDTTNGTGYTYRLL